MKLKNISFLSIIALVLLYALCILVCGCSGEENTLKEEDGSMRFMVYYPGQQEVNIGRSFNSPLVNLFTNSFPSSIIVRSAENVVSNT